MSDSKDYAVYSSVTGKLMFKVSNHDLCEMRKVCSKLTIRQK